MADDHVPTREVVHLEPVSDPLIAFFWARLDEVERVAIEAARDAGDSAWSSGGRFSESVSLADGGYIASGSYGELSWELRQHIASQDLKSVLDDVAAKKAILDDYVSLRDRCAAASSEYHDWLENKPVPEPGTPMGQHDPARRDELRRVIKRLATVYAGHPDYREDFRP